MSCGSQDPRDERRAGGGSTAACLCWKLSVRFSGGLTRQERRGGYSGDIDAGHRTGAFLPSRLQFHTVVSQRSGFGILSVRSSLGGKEGTHSHSPCTGHQWTPGYGGKIPQPNKYGCRFPACFFPGIGSLCYSQVFLQKRRLRGGGGSVPGRRVLMPPLRLMDISSADCGSNDLICTVTAFSLQLLFLDLN